MIRCAVPSRFRHVEAANDDRRAATDGSGSSSVPLGAWLVTQRTRMRKGELAGQQLADLQKLADAGTFLWKPDSGQGHSMTSTFEAMILVLEDFCGDKLAKGKSVAVQEEQMWCVFRTQHNAVVFFQWVASLNTPHATVPTVVSCDRSFCMLYAV